MTPRDDSPDRMLELTGLWSDGLPPVAVSPTHFFSSKCPPDASFDLQTPDGYVSADDLPGPEFERYELLERIAEGGMGTVFLARDHAIGRLVALKVLREDLSGRPGMVARFHREARITGQLDHPGVVPVYDAGRLGNRRPFMAMKYVRGRSLGELLAARPHPGHHLPHWLGAFARLCQTVLYAHARGVVHRDIKPDNVVLCGVRQLYLLDWGLARLLGEPADEAADRVLAPVGLPAAGDTAHGALLGTPEFVAPEQANGRPVDERADVFGLGAVLCVLLTGRPPFAAASRPEVIARARAGDLADAHRRLDGSGADGRLVRLAKACLAADPADRPRRVTEVLTALNAARQPDHADPPA